MIRPLCTSSLDQALAKQCNRIPPSQASLFEYLHKQKRHTASAQQQPTELRLGSDYMLLDQTLGWVASCCTPSNAFDSKRARLLQHQQVDALCSSSSRSIDVIWRLMPVGDSNALPAELTELAGYCKCTEIYACPGLKIMMA